MIKKIKKFINQYPVLAFLIIILLTILITRGFVYYIVDPDLKIFNVELHHFDYGLVGLIVISLRMLFGKKHFELYLMLLAIFLGLIIDELWFIKKQIGGNNSALYNPSLIYVISLTIILTLIIFLVKYFSRRINYKNENPSRPA